MNARRAPITELLLRAVYTGASAAAPSAANCFNRPYLTMRLNKSRIYVATYEGHGTMTVLTKRPTIILDNPASKDCKMSKISEGTINEHSVWQIIRRFSDLTIQRLDHLITCNSEASVIESSRFEIWVGELATLISITVGKNVYWARNKFTKIVGNLKYQNIF